MFGTPADREAYTSAAGVTSLGPVGGSVGQTSCLLSIIFAGRESNALSLDKKIPAISGVAV
jgi:hypothetical protein